MARKGPSEGAGFPKTGRTSLHIGCPGVVLYVGALGLMLGAAIPNAAAITAGSCEKGHEASGDNATPSGAHHKSPLQQSDPVLAHARGLQVEPRGLSCSSHVAGELPQGPSLQGITFHHLQFGSTATLQQWKLTGAFWKTSFLLNNPTCPYP